jgi:type IV pilus assembly protein PilM
MEVVNILMKKLNCNIDKIKYLMNTDIKDLKFKLPKKNINFNKVIPEKKKKVVAFDLGSSTIKIVEGTYYKNELTIDKYIKIPSPKDAVIDGEIKKDDELAIRISEVLKSNNIKAKHGICTTNSTLIINREILIPKVEEEEMDTVVRYEIQQYLPINLDDYVIQVTVLNEEKDMNGSDKLNVRVIAFPDKIAKGYYNLLKKLELEPYTLDVNYNAVNKLVNYIENELEYNSNDAVAFIDMGASFITVNIYKDKKLDFTRIIKAGGNDINDYLYNLYHRNFEECENFKLNGIDLLNLNSQENDSAREIADEWIDKIEKIIQFYRNKNMNTNLEKIIIFGGCSKLKGFDKYMSEKIGIQTRRIKEVSKMTFKSNDDGEPIDDFINVIGSVIRL